MRAYKVTGVQPCFFLQEEDGIRDYKVTGVQTCALPIWVELGGRRILDGVHDAVEDTSPPELDHPLGMPAVATGGAAGQDGAAHALRLRARGGRSSDSGPSRRECPPSAPAPAPPRPPRPFAARSARGEAAGRWPRPRSGRRTRCAETH